MGLSCGEASWAKVDGLGCGDDVGAVDHLVHIVAESRESGEDELEVVLELGLVV